MLEKTWIGVTGQRWKVYLSLVLMSVTALSFVAAMAYLDQEEIFTWGILAFVAVGLIWIF